MASLTTSFLVQFSTGADLAAVRDFAGELLLWEREDR